MRQQVILPTFELVTECLAYDPLFCFLTNGVRDVIGELILAHSPHAQPSFPSKFQDKSGALGMILSEYDDYFSRSEADYPPDYEKLYQEYLDGMAKLELVTNTIDWMVQDLVQSLFQTRLVEFLPEGAYWHRRDFVVWVRSFA